MKPLDPLAQSLLEDARADAPAPDAEARVWEALAKQLPAPLPPTAAAASRALAAHGGVPLLAAPLVKGLIGLLAIGAVAAGFGYRSAHAPTTLHTAPAQLTTQRSPAPQDTTFSPHAPLMEAAATETAQAPQPIAAGSGSSLAEETRLLEEAQRALGVGNARSAARALGLVNEHVNRFPHGKLAQTRDAARVLALCALQRTREARRAQQQFLREWPQSPLTARVQGACSAAAR